MSMYIQIFILLTSIQFKMFVKSVDYQIDFSNPITIMSSIKIIETTSNGNIIIHCSSGVWYVYNSSFFLIGNHTVLNQTWNVLSVITATTGAILNQNRDTVCLLNLTSFLPIFTYNMGGIIQIEGVNTFPSPSISAVNSTSMVSLQSGSIVLIYDFTSNPFINYAFDTSYLLGGAIFSNGEVYKLVKSVSLGKQAYYSITNIYNHSIAANKVKVINNAILFTQDSNNVIMSYNLTGNYSLSVSPLLYSKIMEISQISSNLIFVYSNSFSYVYYNTVTMMFEPVSTISFNFASLNTFQIAKASSNYIGFISNSNTLFAVKICSGNQFYDGLSCIDQTCLAINCQKCSISINICGLCIAGYTLKDDFTCELSSIINLNSTNNTNSSDIINSYNNSTNNSNINSSAFNNSIYETLNQGKICRIFQNKDQNNNCIVPPSNNGWVSILNLTKMINSIPAIRVLVLFCSPLFGFLDDYWFYIYHLKPSQDSFTYLILWELYIINNERYIPNFLPTKIINQVVSETQKVFSSSKFNCYTPQILTKVDQESVYFLSTMSPTIILNWSICFGILLLCRLINKFLSKLRYQNVENANNFKFKVYKQFKKYFQQKALIGILIIALFQSNLIMVSFKGTFQILDGFFFNIKDKINLIITHCIYFLSLLFAVAFYQQLISTDPRKYQSYLSDKKEVAKSFLLQFYFIGLKNMIYGLIHSLFLGKSKIFIFLILTKILLIAAFWKYKQVFKNKITAFLTLIYFFLGILLDGYLLWHQNADNSNVFQQRQLCEKLCIYGLIFTIIIKTFIDGFKQLLEMLMSQQKIQQQIKEKKKQIDLIQNSINKIQPLKISKQSIGNLSTVDMFFNLKKISADDIIQSNLNLVEPQNKFKPKRSSIEQNLQFIDSIKQQTQVNQLKSKFVIKKKNAVKFEFQNCSVTNQNVKQKLQQKVFKKQKMIIKRPGKQKNQIRTGLKVIQSFRQKITHQRE